MPDMAQRHPAVRCTDNPSMVRKRADTGGAKRQDCPNDSQEACRFNAELPRGIRRRFAKKQLPETSTFFETDSSARLNGVVAKVDGSLKMKVVSSFLGFGLKPPRYFPSL